MKIVSGVLICSCFFIIGCNSNTSSKVKSEKLVEKDEQKVHEPLEQQESPKPNKATQPTQNQLNEKSSQNSYIDKSKFTGKWEVITLTIHYTDNSQPDTTFIPPKLMQYEFMSNEKCIITVAETRNSAPQVVSKYYKYFENNSFDFFEEPQISDGIGSYEIFELNDTNMIFRVCFGNKCYIYDLKRIG